MATNRTETDPTEEEGRGGGANESPVLAQIGPGSYFGEISILTKTPCRASIRTLSRCMILRVSKENFEKHWCAIPEFRAEFLIRILGNGCLLEHILDHDLTRREFLQFVQSEHAAENLAFYLRACEFRRTFEKRTAAQSHKEALRILDTYLRIGAPQEVNISAHAREECEQNIEAASNGGDQLTAYTLATAAQEIFTLIEKGPFCRFRKTTAFAQLMQRMRIYENLDQSAVNTQALSPSSSPSKYRRPSLAPPPTSRQQCAFATLS